MPAWYAAGGSVISCSSPPPQRRPRAGGRTGAFLLLQQLLPRSMPPPPAPSRRSRSGVYYATLRQRIPAGFPGCAVASRLLIEKHLLSRRGCVGRPAAHARSLQHGFFVPTVFCCTFFIRFRLRCCSFFCLATLGVFAQCAAVSQQRVMLLF